MKYVPHKYQAACTELALLKPAVGLFLKPGLGKTVITLTALEELISERLEYPAALIIAPKRVCEDVWPAEIAKWDHLRHLTFSLVLGSAKARTEALKKRVSLYIINRENLVWLVRLCGQHWPFKVVVIDELSNFKSSKSERFRAFRRVRPKIERVIGLTGTPRPNSDLDLWAELFCLDGGIRLGTSVTLYKERYFYRPNPYQIYRLEPLPGAPEQIRAKIRDICVSMTAEDYLELPEALVQTEYVTLPDELMKRYRDFERELVLSIDEATITAPTRAVVINKLLQFANGAVYDENRGVHEIHALKLEALKELLEEANGEPVLVFYSFRHDLDRIVRECAEYNPRQLKESADTADWNAGKIRLLLAHPASCAYGLNLQAGGHLAVWFGPIWNQELYEQANDRLHRQGQKETVVIKHLAVRGSVDELVLAALARKSCSQEKLMEALKARVKV